MAAIISDTCVVLSAISILYCIWTFVVFLSQLRRDYSSDSLFFQQEEIKTAVEGVRNRIMSEFNLVNNRITWLLSGTAFLIFSMNIPSEKILIDVQILIPCIVTLGIILASIVSCLTSMAGVAITVLKNREQSLMGRSNCPKSLRITSPDQYDDARPVSHHNTSVFLQSLIPMFVIIFWTGVGWSLINDSRILQWALDFLDQ